MPAAPHVTASVQDEADRDGPDLAFSTWSGAIPLVLPELDGRAVPVPQPAAAPAH